MGLQLKATFKKAFNKENLKTYKGSIIQYGSLLFVIILFSILTSGDIFSAYNIKTLIGQIAPLLIMSVGMVFIFAHGGFDISSGAMVGLNSLIIVLVANATNNILLGTFIVILLSIAMYALECFISIKLGLIPTIASLAIMFAARGIVTYVCSLSDGVVHLNDYSLIQGIKNSWEAQLITIFIIAIIATFIFNFTKLGKQIKAIGDNPLSAKQSGVKVNLVKMICYMIAGLTVGIASLFVVSRSGSITKSIGSGYEMDIMIAIILGGMSLNGGSKSKMSAAIIGSITYRLLSNGMTKAGVPTNYISLTKGIIFIVIILITLRQSKHIKEMPR